MDCRLRIVGRGENGMVSGKNKYCEISAVLNTTKQSSVH